MTRMERAAFKAFLAGKLHDLIMTQLAVITRDPLHEEQQKEVDLFESYIDIFAKIGKL